ncbi:MAG: condensation domain-containing protein [Gammaproteobacteria bacterium]
MSGPLPENIEDAYPLTPLQQGMLFHSISSPETGVYIEQISVAIDQPAFSVEAFKNSWELLLQRHSAFRTAFVWKDLNEPLQVVRKRVTLSWNDIDWRELDHCAQQSELEQLKQSDRETELSLNKAPLMHMTLVRLSDERYIWVWTRHHLIADGWSTSHVLARLFVRFSEPDQT